MLNNDRRRFPPWARATAMELRKPSSASRSAPRSAHRRAPRRAPSSALRSAPSSASESAPRIAPRSAPTHAPSRAPRRPPRCNMHVTVSRHAPGRGYGTTVPRPPALPPHNPSSAETALISRQPTPPTIWTWYSITSMRQLYRHTANLVDPRRDLVVTHLGFL